MVVFILVLVFLIGYFIRVYYREYQAHEKDMQSIDISNALITSLTKLLVQQIGAEKAADKVVLQLMIDNSSAQRLQIFKELERRLQLLNLDWTKHGGAVQAIQDKLKQNWSQFEKEE